MRSYLLWLGASLLLPISACSFPDYSGKPTPQYRQNPNPKQRYDLTMTIANAPGVFKSVESFMQYDVVNSECLLPPDSNPVGYNSSIPTAEPVIEFKKISDTEYVGTFFTDMMIDEDYYGRGVCHWRLVQAGARLKAIGVDGETTFFSTLELEEITAEKSLTTYFWKGHYPLNPEVDLENPVSFGQKIRSKMASNLTDEDVFSITLASNKVRP